MNTRLGDITVGQLLEIEAMFLLVIVTGFVIYGAAVGVNRLWKIWRSTP